MFRAPGDQVGFTSEAGSVVSRVSPPPSAFMRKMSSLPARLLVNAIRLPSGDQAGIDVRCPAAS